MNNSKYTVSNPGRKLCQVVPNAVELLHVAVKQAHFTAEFTEPVRKGLPRLRMIHGDCTVPAFSV